MDMHRALRYLSLMSIPPAKKSNAFLIALISAAASFFAIASPAQAANLANGPSTGATLTAGPIAFPAGFMQSIKDFGAVGDGVTNDTKAIQSALSQGRANATGNYNGLPKALYFPKGVYLVDATLTWNGCCVTLQGDGSSTSILRLAPSSPGYGSAGVPKSVLMTPATNTNESFRQNIWDLGITVGSGNPGAIALNYVSNNVGSIHNVSILSEDGKGAIGLGLIRHYPGPLMIKNVSIQGFELGISLTNAYEYSATIEGLTLRNQSVAGISNTCQGLNIRNLHSTNSVPAIQNYGGFPVILDADLTGGSSTSSAIVTNADLFLRNVTSSGYGDTLHDTSENQDRTTRGTIPEYTSNEPVHLVNTSIQESLGLPVEETPKPSTIPLANWIAFVPRWQGDTHGLQDTFNAGKPTVYLPSQAYFSYDQVTINVPDNVDHFIGFGSIVNGSSTGLDGGGILLNINSNATTPLIIEQFGYGIRIEHHGTRPIVLKDGTYTYTSNAGAGNLFLEDVNLQPTIFHTGQKVWARQLDIENSATKINNYGSLWILGLKTEHGGVVIQTNSNAQTELLGALIYPATSLPSTEVAFTSNNGYTSYIYGQSSYCSTCGYATQVQETQSGITRKLPAKTSARFVMPLFIGYQ